MGALRRSSRGQSVFVLVLALLAAVGLVAYGQDAGRAIDAVVGATGDVEVVITEPEVVVDTQVGGESPAEEKPLANGEAEKAAETDDELTKLRSEHADLQEQNRDLKMEVENLKWKMETMGDNDPRIKDMQELVDYHENAQIAAETSMWTTEKKMRDMEARCDASFDKNYEYEEVLKGWEDKGQQFEEALKEWEDKGQQFEEALKEWEDKGQQFEEVLKEREDKGQQFEEALKEWEDKGQQFEEALKEREDKGQQFEEALKKWEDRGQQFEEVERVAVELNQEVVGLKEEIVGLNQEVTGLKEEVTGLQKEAVAAQEAVLVAQEQTVVAQEEVMGLKEEVAAAQEKLAAAQKEVEELTAQAEKKEREVGGKTRELEGVSLGLKNKLAKKEKELKDARSRQKPPASAASIREDLAHVVGSAWEEGLLAGKTVLQFVDAKLSPLAKYVKPVKKSILEMRDFLCLQLDKAWPTVEPHWLKAQELMAEAKEAISVLLAQVWLKAEPVVEAVPPAVKAWVARARELATLAHQEGVHVLTSGLPAIPEKDAERVIRILEQILVAAVLMVVIKFILLRFTCWIILPAVRLVVRWTLYLVLLPFRTFWFMSAGIFRAVSGFIFGRKKRRPGSRGNNAREGKGSKSHSGGAKLGASKRGGGNKRK